MALVLKSDERRYTLGIVYEPDTPDTDGEFAKAEDIEKAAWGYMSRMQAALAQGVAVFKSVPLLDMCTVCSKTIEEHGNEPHAFEEIAIDVSELEEMAKAAENPLDDQHLQVDSHLGTVVESWVAPCDLSIGTQHVKKGSWLLGVVWTEEMFDKIKKGERTGLSMYGRARRVGA